MLGRMVRFPAPIPSLAAGLGLALALAALAPAQTRAPAQTPPGRAPRTLELAALTDLEGVAEPQVSPDGRQVVFTRSWNDMVHDQVVRDLWIVGIDGARPRFLAKGASPRWSPDGTRIAFVRDGEPRGSQIHVMWVDTREVTQVTRVDEAPSAIAWSPDSTRIAFRMVVPERDALRIELPPRPKGAQWAPDPKVVTRLSWRRDQQGDRPKGWQHLFVVDVASGGGTERQVTRGDFDHGAPRWMPDGASLVFDGRLVDDADWQVRESDLYRVDVATGEVENLTGSPGVESDPVVSPDGRHIAFVGHPKSEDTYVVPVVHVLDLETREVRALAADLDRGASNPIWHGSDGLVFTAEDQGRRAVFHVTRSGGRRHRLSPGDVDFVATDLAGDRLVGIVGDPARPGEIAAVDLGWLSAAVVAGAVRRITDVNGDVLDGLRLGAVEEIRVPSPADGLEIQGWLVRPPDFDPARKYPLILAIHGGPHAMYRADFQAEFQQHAAAGYLVLYTNPRGSSGYGKAFGMGIQNAYPGRDYDDLMGCVDHVLAKGQVDPERLFVYGGSGGGVLTCWIVGHTDRFAAAVSMFPVTNWISFVGTTDGPSWYQNFKARPWEDIREHWDRSPLKYVGEVTTPTMFITGELDLRTPIGQTDEFYHALKLRRIDTAMVRVPGEFHGAAGRHPSNRLRRILYVREWFRRHDPVLREPEVPAAPRTATGWTGVLDEREFAKLHELRGDAAPASRGATVDLGGGASAYLSLPDGEAPFPAVVVIHEWWGLNDHIRHWADRLASDGYAALAVDLYGGKVATTPEEALATMQAVDEAEAAAVLRRAHAFLAADPRVRAERRGVIGWCFGGGWALRHAIAEPGLDAAVLYYGRLVTDPEQLARIRAPVLGVFGTRDRGIPPAAVEAWQQAMRAAGGGRHAEVLMCEADHAFANPSSARYDAEHAETAWRRARAFLAERLKR
jgi:dipeptidyl aminopeptidase/acylaminoacyl peptidase